MKKWEAALEKFLRPWRARKHVLGAVVVGSRAFGTDDRFSDIDVHIVMSNRVKRLERGTCLIDGFLIEYFADALRMYPKYFRRGARGGSLSIARMFAHGRILFDKNGTLKRLRRWGKSMMLKPMPRERKADNDFAKYMMWGIRDDLMSLKGRRSPGFWYAYHWGVTEVIEYYRAFLGCETPSQSKMWDLFSSRRFRRGNRMKPFPDPRFVLLAKRCMKAKTVKNAYMDISKLIAHAHRRMGGFEIDGWRYRRKAN